MAYQSVNPFTEELHASFPEHTDAELKSMVKTAHDVYRKDWKLRSVEERAAIVKRAAEILRASRNRFAMLATVEMGKIFAEALVEVDLCASILEFYADKGPSFLAPKPIDADKGSATLYTEPLGVLFCIEPWNFPYYQLVRVAAPNLVAGNTLIVKHAPNVPQCALAFEGLFLDAGAPAGVYTNAFLSNDQAADAIADERVRGVALTGSERAGAAVAAEAGKALKKSTMELGGSDAFIVLDDADLSSAIDWAVKGRFRNAGQSCIAAKRLILVDSIADDFLRGFKAQIAELVAGDPAQDSTTFAPLCSAAALAQAESQITAAVAAGAKLLLGGARMKRSGLFLEPTILTDVSNENPAFHQEFFCPVALVFRVKDEAEAIQLANDSPYGLGASVFSRSIERAQSIAQKIESGMVYINQVTLSAPNLPFGGVKNSGFGRELSELGIGEFVNRKLVYTA